jgi:hypothetical protein
MYINSPLPPPLQSMTEMQIRSIIIHSNLA